MKSTRQVPSEGRGQREQVIGIAYESYLADALKQGECPDCRSAWLVKWISRGPPKAEFRVRIPGRAPSIDCFEPPLSQMAVYLGGMVLAAGLGCWLMFG